LTYCRNLSL